MSTEQEQVQVRFVTKQAKYAVNDSAILVPSSFKRYGLSEIVNNLLDLEKPIPFDFLIDGEILRSSIAAYLSNNLLSTENLLTIEYVESMMPPEPLSAFQHDDWISSVVGYQGFFLTGSYDNVARLWNSSGECIASLTGHAGAVKSVAFGAVKDSSAILFSGSLDHSILAWEYTFDSDSQNILYECKGHMGPVESIAVDSSNGFVASASADSTVKVWTTSAPTAEEQSNDINATVSKKRKVEKNTRKSKTNAVTLEGHVGAVNSVVFDTNDSNIVYTGGWDHSIRSWDVEQQVNLVTKNCEKAVLAVDYSARSQLLATGNTDKTVRLWDPRSEDGAKVKTMLHGHSHWVTSVSWSSASEYLLCTGSYDKTTRIWDIRNKGPLYTIDAEDAEEVLSVHWSDSKVLSGGKDKKLRIFDAKTPATPSL